ncbi:hypothetical protein MVEN_01513600 [Mycena venus]|uniref:Uncharacterized protein n=1 Tax=Mycena venus TaxID=2733690 RepID=A0A8H6XWB2_9AGAR|nr:hypothetical protein MVEN_01513600 [Mycena venus]
MASKPKKKSGVEDWRWGAFWKGKLYQNDKHHKEARCRGEVALEEARLKEEQAEKIRRGAIQPRDALPGDKLHELAKNAVKPLCGKMKYLSKHIRECDSVDIKWKQKLEAAERDESGSDNDTTSATATTSQAVVKSNKRQATFELVAGAKRFRKDHQEDFETDILKLWTSLNASFNSAGASLCAPLFLRSGCPGHTPLGVMHFLGAFYFDSEGLGALHRSRSNVRDEG